MRLSRIALAILTCLAVAGGLAVAQAKPQVSALRVKGIKTVIGKIDAANRDQTRAVGETVEVEDPDLAEGALLEKNRARMCFYCGTVMMELMGKAVYTPAKAETPAGKKRMAAYFKRLGRMLRGAGIADETRADLEEVTAAFHAGGIDELGAALDKLSGTIQDNLEEKLGPDAIWYYSLGYSARGYKLAGQARLYDMVSIIAPTAEDLLSYVPDKVDTRIMAALNELSPISQKNEDEIGPRDYTVLKARSTVILNAFARKRTR